MNRHVLCGLASIAIATGAPCARATVPPDTQARLQRLEVAVIRECDQEIAAGLWVLCRQGSAAHPAFPFLRISRRLKCMRSTQRSIRRGCISTTRSPATRLSTWTVRAPPSLREGRSPQRGSYRRRNGPPGGRDRSRARHPAGPGLRCDRKSPGRIRLLRSTTRAAGHAPTRRLAARSYPTLLRRRFTIAIP
jgi:hypothetical protein